MKDLIKKYLQKQVIDKVGETRPYIDPDFIDIYAGDIEKLVKNNAVLPLVSDTVCDHRYHSRNGRYMLYEGWCEKCGTDISQTGR